MEKEKLITIGNYLLNTKFEPEKGTGFDYKSYRSYDKSEILPCGSCGCAVGHFPFIFPGEWGFYANGNVRYQKAGYHCVATSCEDFLAISENEYAFLFDPDCEYNPLDETAPPEVVGQHILNFVKRGGIEE